LDEIVGTLVGKGLHIAFIEGMEFLGIMSVANSCQLVPMSDLNNFLHPGGLLKFFDMISWEKPKNGNAMSIGRRRYFTVVRLNY